MSAKKTAQSCDRVSLVAFAEAEGARAGVACFLCGIPEREEVERAILSGQVSKAAAARWLRNACGYEKASNSRVGNHMDKHVKRPAA